mmetsp:Transcript_95926/g.277015  ORF Transcript_95926/g.277015 Transcript_95926/m.277015 type:complete len:83 (+) Transcript_95926:566-814(+)
MAPCDSSIVHNTVEFFVVLRNLLGSLLHAFIGSGVHFDNFQSIPTFLPDQLNQFIGNFLSFRGTSRTQEDMNIVVILQKHLT